MVFLPLKADLIGISWLSQPSFMIKFSSSTDSILPTYLSPLSSWFWFNGSMAWEYFVINRPGTPGYKERETLAMKLGNTTHWYQWLVSTITTSHNACRPFLSLCNIWQGVEIQSLVSGSQGRCPKYVSGHTSPSVQYRGLSLMAWCRIYLLQLAWSKIQAVDRATH